MAFSRIQGGYPKGHYSVTKHIWTCIWSLFLEEMTFADLNSGTFERFISWAKEQRYVKKEIKNETINKIFVPLKMICKSAAIEYGWGTTYSPFFGFKKLPEGDPYEKIFPFSIDEQGKLISQIPDHWKPYFRFAFCSGLRQGEQHGLKPEDIDWENNLLHIRRAITLDIDGKIIEGKTKNRYSRRTMKLTIYIKRYGPPNMKKIVLPINILWLEPMLFPGSLSRRQNGSKVSSDLGSG